MPDLPVPGHSLVSVLRPGRTLLVRAGTAGSLAVLRRAPVSRGALERRARASSGGAAAVVEHGGAPHLLRPFAPGRSLAEVLAGAPEPAPALAVAEALASAVAALHARGRVHGRLHPGNAVVSPDGTIALLDAEVPFEPDPADDAASPALGFAAPELLRGGRPSRRSDAFALAAMSYALLSRRAPFEAEAPLEVIRRVLHEDPIPLAVLRPDLPAALTAAVARGLSRSRWKRPSAACLAQALHEAASPTSAGDLPRPVTPSVARPQGARSRGAPTSTPTPSPAPLVVRQAHHERAEAGPARPDPSVALPQAARSRGASLRRLALGSLPVLVLAAVFLPPREGALADEVSRLISEGRLSDARARLDAAAKTRPGDPLVEKLRGDVACARGASGECLRRYRVALAARPALREDPALRENARKLLSGAQRCGPRRAAAELLGELRDPAALPALESARRSGGVFSWFCTGDSIDRAIAATRRAARAER